MTVKFTNNASSTVATGINTSATSLTVADASTFPSLSGADDYCYLTIQGATSTTREVVKATALSSNTFTIVRAQDNTTAGTWSVSDIVELRLTAALLQDVIDQATVEGIKTNFQYIPTANQTQFSGADNSGDTMIINDAELVNVYMNGVRLVQGSDYTVSSSNNRITLTTGATTADVIDIEVFGNFTAQSGAAVAITGGAIAGTAITTGSINNTPIGATQANTVAATTLTANSLTTTGNILVSGNHHVVGSSGSATNSLKASYNSTSGVASFGPDSNGGNTSLNIGTSNSGTFATALTIANTGNATFSGTVSSGQITSTINSGVGIRTTYGELAQFATDSQLDLVSTSGGTWGSAINFVEGANTSNTDVWSIARKTTGGDGDSSLHFNFGTTNSHENTSRVSFSSAGNVGVGKTAGAVRIDVETDQNGNLAGQFKNTHASGSYGIKVMGGHDSSNYSAVFTDKDNTTLMMIRGNGNVGIGLDNPHSYSAAANDLVVGGSGSQGITIASGTSSTGNLFFADSTSGNAGYRGYVQYQHNGDKLVLGTASDDRVFIDSSGSAGFGTSSPRRHIHLHNSSSATTKLMITNGATGESNDSQGFQIGIDSSGNAVVENRENTNLTFYTNNSPRITVLAGGKVLIGDVASHTTDLLQIETPASGGGHGIQIRREDSNSDQQVGHILFGNNTATDLASLIAKTDGATDSGAMLFSTSPTGGSLTERLRINSNGSIAINSTATNRELTIAAPTNQQCDLALRAGDDSDYCQLLFGDTSADNTGIVGYKNGDEFMFFNTGGQERMRIVGGHVGIGVSSPSSYYSTDLVVGAADQGGITIAASGTTNTNYLLFADGTSGDAQYRGQIAYQHDGDKLNVVSTGIVQFMSGSGRGLKATLSAAGNLNIGMPSGYNAEGKLHVYNGASGKSYAADAADQLILENNSSVCFDIRTPSSNNGVILFSDESARGSGQINYSHNGDTMYFMTAGASRMNISGTGKITASSSIAYDFISYFQQTNANGYLLGVDTASSALVYFYKSGSTFVGSISTNGSTVAYNTSSDQRLKQNIQDADADAAGELIDAIQVRQFDWKADGRHQNYGTVAQELASVVPDAVSTSEDPDEMMGVDYSTLVPMLIKEIQTLRSRVAELENN